MMNRRVLYTVFALALFGGSTAVASRVFAQSETALENPKSVLVQKIAEKFGLKSTDVQAVFDEEWQVRRNAIEKRFEDKLSALVSDGKITDAQKNAILSKRAELEAKRKSQIDSIKGMTETERKEHMNSERNELEQWASQNNIDMKYMFMGFGKGFGHRMMWKIEK